MKVTKLLHAAILVADLERAKAFYGAVLGLQENSRYDFDFEGAWYNLGDCELHLMMAQEALPAAAERPRRDYHVAFAVDDLDVAKHALEEAGIPYRPGRPELAQLFLRDPDGNLVELQQR